MYSKNILLGLSGFLIGTSLVYAGELGPVGPQGVRLVASVFGGVAYLNTNHWLNFVGDDGDVFTYHNNENNSTTGLGGAFVGAEFRLPFERLVQSGYVPLAGFFMQAGLEYSYYGSVNVRGYNTVGIEPATSTLYNYQYDINTSQVLAVAKLYAGSNALAVKNHMLYPYFSVGLGGAFNSASRYNAWTQETGSINVTPIFSKGSNGSFSYALGLGVDADITQKKRLGLGYRFSDLGKASLGAGAVVVNNYSYPVAFTPHVPNIYSNQLVAQLSYVA